MHEIDAAAGAYAEVIAVEDDRERSIAIVVRGYHEYYAYLLADRATKEEARENAGPLRVQIRWRAVSVGRACGPAGLLPGSGSATYSVRTDSTDSPIYVYRRCQSSEDGSGIPRIDARQITAGKPFGEDLQDILAKEHNHDERR